MKKINLWMLAAILTCGFLTTACGVIENPIERKYSENVIDEFEDVKGNDGDSAVIAALLSIENVVDLKPFKNDTLGQAYYFNYIQPVDHSDPSKGTFKQQVVLTFADKDANTILHTEGYSLAGDDSYNNFNRMDKIEAPHLLWALSEDYGAKKFDLNCVQVEYRYHGFSLPEGDRNSFKYLSALQHSQDLHAIVTDLKEALITGDGKWISTGVSKNGVTTAQYAYYDEQNGWDDIDVYVPFVAPITPQAKDLRIGTYMLTESSKEVLPALEKAYRKLADDQAIMDATIAALEKKYGPLNTDDAGGSINLAVVGAVMNGLFDLESYGDFDTWKKLIPTEKSTPEEYAKFFVLNQNDTCIFRKAAAARGPLAWREDPFEKQIPVDQGNLGWDYTWFLEGKLFSAAEKKALKDWMDSYKKSDPVDLQIALLKNLETTTKKLIFVYGGNDPWTGAAIPDPTNPNVKKHLVPYGTHTDNFIKYAWYPGGEEVAKKIVEDIKTFLSEE